jgi:two-component system, sensor histidine kinase and response regulator
MEETRLEIQNLNILVGGRLISEVQNIKTMLRKSFDVSVNIETSDTLGGARQILLDHKIDIVLLDLDLADDEGMQTFQTMREITRAPIVVLTSNEDESLALNALKAGAEDFLFKRALTPIMLWRSITYTIERHNSHIIEKDRLHLLELREDFMATLTHDLKNPLIGSNRLIELIAEGNVRISAEQQSNLLLQVRDSNNSLLGMIQSLYDVYRYEKDRQTLHLEKTDLLAMVNQYLGSVRHLMEDKRITTHVVNNAKDPVVLADSISISRVMQNLIENAIKFSPLEGRVEINLRTDEDKVVIDVSDQGPGIELEDHHKLFRRFYQGRPGRVYNYGMGLGLYLCRQIVEAHSGQIWCSPKEDNGSTFTVSLPTSVGSGQ